MHNTESLEIPIDSLTNSKSPHQMYLWLTQRDILGTWGFHKDPLTALEAIEIFRDYWGYEKYSSYPPSS